MLKHGSYFSAGLSFAVYTFPIIAIAIIGLLLLDLKSGYESR